MFRHQYSIIYILISLFLVGCSSNMTSAYLEGVYFVNPIATLCPASNMDRQPPDLPGTNCERVQIEDIDPQNTHIWATFTLRIPDSFLDSPDPLGFGITAKASSWVYINGREIGRNGTPSSLKATEQIGQMDIAFPLREGVLKAGDNEIAVRLSSHSGFLNLGKPFHTAYVARYERPQARLLRQYAPSLLPFGVFILGALYFLIMAIFAQKRQTSALLGLMSATIACQLFAEVSRGVFSYNYPWHDVRLLAILIFSTLFGLCLSFYSLKVFVQKQSWIWVTLIITVMIIVLLIPESFDTKASLALLSQTAISLVMIALNWKSARAKALTFFIVLSFFAAMNIIAPGRFLDIYFFYLIALLMLFLFTQQALAHGEAQKQRQQEEIRANTLQLILDQRQSETATLSIFEAGKIRRLQIHDVVSLSAAGDYVEIHLSTGKMRLASATLAELEAQLPAIFLRVHRSHIVNTGFIQTLERDPSGTGQLKLTTDKTLPVSRRIMPNVRKALA